MRRTLIFGLLGLTLVVIVAITMCTGQPNSLAVSAGVGDVTVNSPESVSVEIVMTNHDSKSGDVDCTTRVVSPNGSGFDEVSVHLTPGQTRRLSREVVVSNDSAEDVQDATVECV